MDRYEWIFSEETSFEEGAARIYRRQRAENPVYARFCEALGAGEELPTSADEYPLLPVKAFGEQRVITGNGTEGEPKLVFRSSGTGDAFTPRSVHDLADASLYRTSLMNGFKRHYEIEKAVIWALTPGYDENPDSSLVWMLRELIKASGSPLSRFLTADEGLGADALEVVAGSGRGLILFGAAFGLLDLLERTGDVPLPADSVVIETGGMKTRRRETDRKTLHRRLSEGFQLDRGHIHSEYGMAEMLSQAYATGGEWFRCPPWLRATVRDHRDPMRALNPGREGLLGFVDLANLHSCSFLLTGDRGVLNRDGAFQVPGRWNEYDLRGCNFLIDRD